MSKRILWAFDQKDTIYVKEESKKAGNEKSFKFKLTRYKNSQTHEERLRIESFLEGNENGYIDTSIYNLDKDIKDFRKYGVAFSDIVYMDLRQEILKRYLSLETITAEQDDNAPKMVNPVIMDIILRMIAEAAEQYGKSGDGRYNIPIVDFNDLINKSEYGEYDLNSIKKWLKDKGYTKCSIGRTSTLARLKKNQNPTRVISLYADKIEKYINVEDKKNKENQIDG
ncbi:MAG: hypothetical protein GX974_04485 [Clostridiales bacterium]|nr:hypothetical protein [Clostridiales bacterium]